MPLETALHYVNIFASVVLVTRLWASRLGALYRSFLLLMCYEAIFGFLEICIRLEWLRVDYRSLWLFLEPIHWILYVAVCYSLMQRLLADHPGIYSVSKKVLIGCFAVAGLVSILSGRIEYGASGLADLPVNLGLIIDRAVCTGALLVLLLTLSYLLWFPVEVARNVAFLSAGLAIYFASETALLLERNIWSPNSLRLVSTVLILISTACVVIWISFLNSAGEQRTVRPGHSWNPNDRQKLLTQLDALNSVLVRNHRH
jgi:hypothetical protein